MNPSFLVLTNLSKPAEQAARWAAVLGAPLQVRLALLHLYQNPVLAPELMTVTAPQAYRSPADTAEDLRTAARRLPAAAEVSVSLGTLHEAVAEAVQRSHPLLLAMGLSAEHDLLDHFLHNQALPVLRATQRPLLLVPEAAPPPAVPRRVLIAVDAEPFSFNAAARALAPLLAAWPAAYTVVHVRTPHQTLAQPGQMALADVRASCLLPANTPLALQEESGPAAAAGILQAVAATEADLLVLVARRRSFLGRLFHRSVTAQVLHEAPVPVLLLPALAPDYTD